MRRTMFGKYLVVLVSISLWLSGCNGVSGPDGSANPPQTGPTSSAALEPLKTDYENALPVAMQLALGLFKLEETSATLTSEQAAALVPLWKAYRSLTNSGEGSSKEIEALIVQIQDTLNDDQLRAIADMQLTMQDLMQLMQDKNLALGGGSGGPNLSAEERATREAQRFSGQGGGPGGGPGRDIMIIPGGPGPGGGGMGPGGELPPGAMMTPGARQTAVARRPEGLDNMVSPALVEALIVYLKSKAP